MRQIIRHHPVPVVFLTAIVGLLVLVLAQDASAYTPRLKDYRECIPAIRLHLAGQSGVYLKTTAQIPDGAVLVSARAEGDCVILRYYDRSFELVPVGEAPPVVDVGYTLATPDMPEFWAIAQDGYMTWLRRQYGW